MTDLEFVQSCVKGDKLAWDEFINKYSRLIYNYIHSVLKIKGSLLSQQNIEDLFQEIILSLIQDNFKKLKSFKAKNGCSLASWLRQVVVNYTIDYIRKLKPTVSIDEENEEDVSLKEVLADTSAPVTDKLAKDERLAHLKDCIKKLETGDKYFLELYLARGLGLEELKRIFRVTRGAIDMRKARLIERLRECFKSKGFLLDF